MDIPNQPSPNGAKASTGGIDSRGDAGFAPAIIPDHTLLRPIGRGSYGEVWLARNIMGAFRAIKIVHRKAFADRRPFDRELSGIRKFEPISRSHDGFVDVLHAGLNEEEGYFYYVMEVGDDVKAGQQIDPADYSPRTLGNELAPAGKLRAQECLQLGLALSSALAELHKHGFVHRDIKPSNIIFVNGTPKLADIGLVAEINEARSYVGTEGFIPPEGPGAPQADIYALGKVLYEVLTGKDRHCYPELPTNWDNAAEHQLAAELNEIILEACQSEASRRYRTASDMHANLLLVMNGKSVKRLRMLERRLDRLRRLALVAAPVLLIAVAVAYHFYRAWRMDGDARQKEVGQNIAYGTRAVEAADPSAALPYFAQALELELGDREREELHRVRFGTTLSRCARLEYMSVLPGDVASIAFNPDGSHLLVAQKIGKGRVIDIVSGKSFALPPAYLARAAYSPNGDTVATADYDGKVFICAANNGSIISTFSHSKTTVSCVSFSPDGSRLVTGCHDGMVRVWRTNAINNEPEWRSLAHTGIVSQAVFSHDGTLIVTSSRDGSVKLWNPNSGQVVRTLLENQRRWMYFAAFSPDDSQVVVADDRKARVFEVASGREVLPAMRHDNVVQSVEFSPDGRYILTASLDHTARLWLALEHEPVSANAFLRHSGRVQRATFDSTGVRIATSCDDGTILVWNLAPKDVVPSTGIYCQDGSRFLTREGNSVEAHDAVSNALVSPRMTFLANLKNVELSPKGQVVVAISHPSLKDGPCILQLRNAVTGQAVCPDLAFSNSLDGFELSDDASLLVTFQGRFLRIWDAHSAKPLTEPLDHGEPISAALFDRAGRRLLVRGTSLVTMWEPATGRRVFAPLKYAFTVSFTVRDAEFSPDGALFVVCGTDTTTKIFPAEVRDSSTGLLKFKVEQDDGILMASFDPAGRHLATGSEDHSAAIWNVPSGEALVHACQHGNQVKTASFSRDGKWLLTASADGTARVWNAATGEPLTPPLRHSIGLSSAQFAGNGDQVLTVEMLYAQHLWTLSSALGPAADLRDLADLLSGGRIVPSGGKPAKKLTAELWHQLFAKYPSAFVTSQEDVSNWDLSEADQAEVREEWRAASFHLERLLKLAPNDASLMQRLARANSRLKQAQ